MKKLIATFMVLGVSISASAQSQYYCKLGLKLDGVRSVVDLGYAVADSDVEAANMWAPFLQQYRDEGFITDYVICKKKKAKYQ